MTQVDRLTCVEDVIEPVKSAAVSNPAISLNRVDFPEPDGQKAVHCPAFIVRSISFNIAFPDSVMLPFI